MDTFMNQYLDPHPSVGVIERLTAVRNNKVSILEVCWLAQFVLVRGQPWFYTACGYSFLISERP